MKKMVSFIVALALLFTMVPFAMSVDAQNTTVPPIYVGGILITEANKADVLGDGTVSFNNETKVLTLRNADICNRDGGGGNFNGIVIPRTDGRIISIELIGDNTVTTVIPDGLNHYENYGIYVENSVYFFGEGTLVLRVAKNVSQGVLAAGIYAPSGDINIQPSAELTINLQNGSLDARGIFARGLILWENAVLIINKADAINTVAAIETIGHTSMLANSKVIALAGNAGIASNGIVAYGFGIQSTASLETHTGDVYVTENGVHANNSAICVASGWSFTAGTVVATNGTCTVAPHIYAESLYDSVIYSLPQISNLYKGIAIGADNPEGKNAKELSYFVMGVEPVTMRYFRIGLMEHKEVCPSRKFTDVSSDAWYHESVDDAVGIGLLLGTSEDEFSPNMTATRGQFVTVLWRLIGSPDPQFWHPFIDVPKDAYYAKAVGVMYEYGIVAGTGGTNFSPEDTITREQLITIFYRAFSAKVGLKAPMGTLNRFKDKNSVSAYAVKAMEWGVHNGLIYGTDSNVLSPKSMTTRAQIAAFYVRLVEKIVGQSIRS